MQNLPELITGAANFVWGASALLAFCVFLSVLVGRDTPADVRRLMLGVMLACLATLIDKMWWSAFRFFLYHGEPERAGFFMRHAHAVVAGSAAVALGAYYLHVRPYFERLPRGAALYWIGAAAIALSYVAIIL